MTFSNISSFNNTYKALSATNIAKESSSTIKKGGAFSPNFAETTSIMRASLDNQWENAYIIKYQALMQNRLNALKQELTAAYNNLLQQASSQQVRENGSNNTISATTDVYGRMLPGADGTVNQAFKGLKYYDDKTALDIGDTKGVWDGSTSKTQADGIPSYYVAAKTYQYDSSGNPIEQKTENVEMRKLYVSGPAMQIANDMKVTFRSEEVLPKATDSSSPFSFLGNDPNPNPAFKAGEKVAEYSTEVKTGGFWSTINYLYDFSPRELKYAYATSYSTTTEESGTRNYTDADGLKQATLYSGKIVDARDMQAKGGLQTDEDGATPILTAFPTTAVDEDNPRFGARVKWNTSSTDDGYVTERNPLIDLYATANDKQNAKWTVPGGIDDRLITRRTSDNDNNFPYLSTLFNSFGDVVKGNTTAIGTPGTPGYKAPDPWSGYKNSMGDQQANDLKIYGTEEGGVTSLNSRIKWEYQHDGDGAIDVNRDAQITGSTSSTITVPAGGVAIPTGIPAGGLAINLTGRLAYYTAASPTNPTFVGPGSVTIPTGAYGLVPANGIDIASAGNITLTAGNDFNLILGGTMTIPSSGIKINSVTSAFNYTPPSGPIVTVTPASTFPVTIPAGSSGTITSGSNVTVLSGSNITIPAGSSGATISGPIPATGVTIHNEAGLTAFSYTGAGAPVSVANGTAAVIPSNATGTIPANSTATITGAPITIPVNGVTVNNVASDFNITVGAAGLPIPAAGIKINVGSNLPIPMAGITTPSGIVVNSIINSFTYLDSSSTPVTVTSAMLPHTIPAGYTGGTISAGSVITLPAGSTGTIASGTTVTIMSGSTNVVLPANSGSGNVPVGSTITIASGGLQIPASGINVTSAGSDFTYTPSSSTINVPPNADVTIPPGAVGTIVSATTRIPEGSTIKIPAGSTYDSPTLAGTNPDVHVAKAAFINHYQVAIQEVELNSNPDSYGRVLALGHKRVNSNVATSDPYAIAADPMNAVATKILRSGGIDASMEHIFSDIDNKYDAQGKLIHQSYVDPDGNGQDANEKMMLPGSGKIAKNFTPNYVADLHQITSFNGQSLGAHGGNVTISSETANSTPVVLGEYEGFKRAQTMSIGLAHDIYNDMGQQVRTYQEALNLKKKIEAEINASSMVDTDWHYSEYASSTGGTTLDGIMFRNVRKITYNDPDKGVGEFNIYYDKSRRDDILNNTYQYVDPSTGVLNSMQGTQEDTFNNVNVGFRKAFTLTKEQFQTLDYQQINASGSNPVEAISPSVYASSPSYKDRVVKIDVNTNNVDINTLDLIVNGNVVSGTTVGSITTYDIAPYLQEGDNVIASQMRVTTAGTNDYFKLTSTSTNNKDISDWITAKISTDRVLTGDAASTELTNATNAGAMLSSWQSKIMANEVRPSLYASIYPASNPDPTVYMTTYPTNSTVPSTFESVAPVVNTTLPTPFTLATSTPPGVPSFPVAGTRPPTDFIAQFPCQGQGPALFASLYPVSASAPAVRYYSPDGATNSATSGAPNTVAFSQAALDAYTAVAAKTVYYVDSNTGEVTGYFDGVTTKNPTTGAVYTPPAIPRPVGADVPMSVQAYNAFFNGGPATAFYVDATTGQVNGYVDTSTGAIKNPSTGAFYTPAGTDLEMSKVAYNNYYNSGPATAFYLDPATGVVKGYVDPVTGSIKNPTTGAAYTPVGTDVKLSKAEYSNYYTNGPAIAYYVDPTTGAVKGVVDPNTGRISNPTTGASYTPLATDKAMSNQAYVAFSQYPLPKFYVNETTGKVTGNPADIPMTEQAYNAYGEALMGLGSTKTATKVKDSNTFLKILMEAMNKKEYQDIFALGLLNSSLGKDMVLKGQLASPSGGNIQSTLSIKYDNINNKFSLVQTKWDAAGGPQQS